MKLFEALLMSGADSSDIVIEKVKYSNSNGGFSVANDYIGFLFGGAIMPLFGKDISDDKFIGVTVELNGSTPSISGLAFYACYEIDMYGPNVNVVVWNYSGQTQHIDSVTLTLIYRK